MSGSPPRMTQTTQAVLRTMLDAPGQDLYVLGICAPTALPSGTVHPILARFEALGWLDSSWEQVDPREQGRPRRRYYRLNDKGIGLARDALARVYETRTRIITRLRPASENG